MPTELRVIRQLAAVERYDGTYESLSKIFQNYKPDYVIHLASFYTSEHVSADIDHLVDSNLRFPIHLVEAATNFGVKYFINSGSSWQYYEGNRDSSVNLYAAMKSAFESVLRFYVDSRDFKVLTLLLYDTYGPRDPRNKIVASLFKAAKSGGVLELSPGEQKIDLVHVEDVVAAFAQAAEWIPLASDGYSKFGVFSGNLISIRELVDLCRDQWRDTLEVKFSSRAYRLREVMVPSYPYATLPSWAPRIALPLGIRSLAIE